MEFYSKAEFEAAADYVKAHTRYTPRIGVVLGSGLGAFADSVEDADIIPYGEIPNWPVSTVQGHSGQLNIGMLEGQYVMVMRGRSHFYEGYPVSQITLPIRVMQLMGVEVVILTNAAGGINPSFAAGDIMMISDHINFPGMAGHHPLRGPNDEALGVRFPNMSSVYDRDLRNTSRQVAADLGIPLQEGVYVCLSGPSFETPAEIRFLRAVGIDAVGMSTVPEATVAGHGSMRVLGFSGISNVAIDDPDSDAEASHEEVLEAGKVIAPRLESILRGILRRI